ncbi:MAG: metal-dependent transcriptional regulator [Flavobacteriales bacterium]
MPTNSKENYLKAVLKLEGEAGEAVTTNSLAHLLKMRPASVTGMVRGLAEAGWVEYEAYRGVNLTQQGREIAVDIVRKHRLWEVFLVEKLGFGWESVHELAEQLEHVDAPELVNRLDEYLGQPAFDPHGDPIPTASGAIRDERKLARLVDLDAGKSGVVKGVVDSGDAFLAHLNVLGIRIGSTLKVLNRFPFDGSVELLLESSNRQICSREVVQNLWVEPQSEIK